MKPLTLALAICSILALPAHGQILSGSNSPVLGPTSLSGPALLRSSGAVNGATNGSRILQSAGPNSRTWLVTAPATNAASLAARAPANLTRPGSVPAPQLPVARPHKVVELAGGLNYWNSETRTWSPSVASFEVVSNAFVARQVQQQVSIEPDLRVAGAVSLTTPQGVIESTPTAIVLYDEASGKSLMIGTITNCQGVLMSSNRVGFANAFCGVCADVIYTINRGSFHQDVVITGKIDPAQYGFPSNSTRIQIMTELYKVPQYKAVQRPLATERDPAIRQRKATPDLVDSELHFGSLVFGLGHAYAAPAPANTNGASAVVAKEIVTDTSSGRTFLIESVRHSSIARGLAALPDCQAGTAAVTPPRQPGSGDSVYAAIPALPASTRATAMARPARGGEQAALAKRPEVVIDYVAVVNYYTTVFQGDTTYLVEGRVDFYSPVVFEGNAVIKYTGANGMEPACLYLHDNVTFNSSTYRPVIFTAIDDDSVGASCYGYDGYTGDPYDYGPYASPALYIQTGTNNVSINNACFRFAGEAMQLDTSYSSGGEQALSCSHAQFVNCVVGCGASGSSVMPRLDLRNCLLSSISNALALWDSSGTLQCVNCTFDNITSLIAADPASSVTNRFDNCILANVQDLGVTSDIPGGVNGFYQTTPFGSNALVTYDYPFQSVAGGYHYLADVSDITNSIRWLSAGDTNTVPADLLPQLRQLTAYPPSDLGSWYPSGQTTLGPTVARDADGTTLGYHYAPLDYLMSEGYIGGGTENSVTVAAGTAIGWTGYGLSMGDSSLTFQGTATSNCWMVQNCVSQEQPYWYSYGCGIWLGSDSGPSQLSACFANWSAPGGAANHLGYVYNGALSANQCEFYGGGIVPQYSPGTVTFCLTDCLLDRVALDLEGSAALRDCAFHAGSLTSQSSSSMGLTNCLLEFASLELEGSVGLRNCTFHYGTLTSQYTSSVDYVIADNSFDGTTLNVSNLPSIHYLLTLTNFYVNNNAYLDGADRIQSDDFWEWSVHIVTDFNWQAGPLGNYYLPFDSPLMNVGSVTADQVGLYHFTTQTNQAKEGFSTVDLGYHYVALDGSGNPLDYDNDGIPDYLADANGNGQVDPGETPWQEIPPAIVSQPAGQTVYAGANVTFAVAASGTLPLSYQWQFNGTNLPGANASSFTRTNVQGADTGQYCVTVSNLWGSVTSSNASLLVRSTIFTQPASRAALVGSNVSFTVTASGSPPLAYQWRVGGAVIPGATNATLMLTNVQLTDAGDYSVVVSNFVSWVISSNATLWVFPPGPATVPYGLISWWPAETNALDVVGPNNGTLTNGGYAAGKVGSAFSLNGTNQYVSIPDNPSLHQTNFTVEGWFNYLEYSGRKRMLFGKACDSGTTDSLVVWCSGSYLYAGVNASSDTYWLCPSRIWVPASNTWHHIALTFDSTTRVETLYVDGTNMASATASSCPAFDAHPLLLGADTRYGTPTNFFKGRIDEVSFYGRALSWAEIQSIYLAGSSGKCPGGSPPFITSQPLSQAVPVGSNVTFSVAASGSPPLAYQWQFNGTTISGATGTTLVLTNVQLADAGNYSVVVSNATASVSSSNATLTVRVPPSVDWVSPTNNSTLFFSTNLTLSVNATPQNSNTISLVEFFFGNGIKLGQTTSGSNGLFNLTWTNPPPGIFSLIARATDSYGLQTSATITNVTLDTLTFLEGVNLGGTNSVTIGGNTWWSYTYATNHGLLVSNATAGSISLTNLIPATDLDTSNMLQTFVRRYRLPLQASQLSANPQVSYVWLLSGTNVPCWDTDALANMPTGYIITNGTNYSGWGLHYGYPAWDNQPTNCVLFYTYGLQNWVDAPFARTNMNRVNYMLNHRTNATRVDVQTAFWLLMDGRLTAEAIQAYPPTARMTNLYNDAWTNGANFVPGAGQIVAVVAETHISNTNLDRLAIEVTNQPVNFTLTQTGLSNGLYQVRLWLAEDEADHLRSLDISLQGALVASGVGSNLNFGCWTNLGPYTASVTNASSGTNGTLTIQVTSQALGDPVMMGLAIYRFVATNQPVSVQISNPDPVCPNHSVTLTAAASGLGPFAYSWYKDSTLLAGQTSTNLSLAGAPSDAGTYSVVATAANSLSATNSTVLTVLTNVTATALTNQTACPGSTVIFGTTASGSGTLTYTWTKNGSVLSGQNWPSLTLTNVSATNAGLYCVEVFGLCGNVTNCATLTIPTAPQVSWASPTNGAVFHRGTNVTLKAQVPQTNAAITGVLFLDGANPLGSVTTGSNNLYSLVMTNVGGSVPEGQRTLGLGTNILTAIATNTCGQAATSGAINVRVISEPDVAFITPTNGSGFSAGDPITLTAMATQADGATIANVSFYNNTTNFIGIVTSGATNQFTLLWTNAPAGTNVLTARATDTDGLSNSAFVTITINYQLPSIRFLSPPSSQLFPLSPTNVLLVTADTAPGATTNLTVAFYTNGVFLGNAALAGGRPLNPNGECTNRFLWQGVWPGAYSVTAWVTNDKGFTAHASITNLAVNAAPFITLVAPTNSTTGTNLTTFTSPTNLTLRAFASDPDSTNLTVQFFYRAQTNGYSFWTNLPGLATCLNTTNFSLTWTNCPVDTHVIYATATDTNGISGASGLVVFNVTPTHPPPSVHITWPTNNAVFSEGASFAILATATNSVGGGIVTNVEFFVTSYPASSQGTGAWARGVTSLLGSDTNAPYSMAETWKSGTYTLAARARDNLGAWSVSSNVSITVSQQQPTGNGFWDPFFTNAFPDLSHRGYPVTAMKADGTNLYVGGWEDIPIFRWDGTTWTGLGDGSMVALAHAIALDGTNLYGGFCPANSDWRNIASWNGSTWTHVGDNYLWKYDAPPVATIFAVAFLGSDLYVGGDFTYAAMATNNAPEDTNICYIARFNRSTSLWERVGNGLNGTVFCLATVGDKLFAGGIFTNAGGNTNINFIARLDGNVWTNLATGVGGTNSWGNRGGVYALAASGNDLFVGGDFTSAGGNTNANGIAKWDGTRWSAIGQGLAGSDIDDSRGAGYDYWDVYSEPPPIASVRVFSITAQGNTIFVGGEFRQALQGTTLLQVNHIAKAVWSEDTQDWTWSDLDQGVALAGGGHDYVAATALLPGPTTNSYDLFAGGRFDAAGSAQTYSFGIARWSVGRAYPSNSPSISITVPANNSAFNSLDPITLQAVVHPGTGTVSQVHFFIDGNDIGTEDSSSGNLYTKNWTPTSGSHGLTAAVTFDTTAKALSQPTLVTVKPSNSSVTAHDDSFTVLQGNASFALPVLTNDVSTDGPLRIESVFPGFGGQLRQIPGRFSIAPDGVSITYLPFPDAFGTDRFNYSVTNSAGGSDFAWVAVNILAKPSVRIDSPYDGDTFGASSNVALHASAWSRNPAVAVTNLDMFLNGTNRIAHAAANFLNAAWATNLAGFYTFGVVATDTQGLTNSASPVTIAITNATTATNLVIAAISNLNAIPGAFGGFIYPVVRDGLFDVLGQADDPIATDSVSYQLLLCRPEDNQNLNPGDLPIAFANVTPGTLDAAGFRSGRAASDLGTIDLTTVPNGTYDLFLVVHGGGGQTNVSARFQLDTQLKIGQFSFSEQDLTIPVNGIPLTVVRSYNSLSTINSALSTDFGPGWTYSLLGGMDVQLDEQRRDVTIGGNDAPFADDEEDANGLPRTVSLRTGGRWDVTLTLPDGRRTTFASDFLIGAGSYGAFYNAVWRAAPGVTATLTTLGADATGGTGDNTLVTPPGMAYYWNADGVGVPMETHDFPGFILTTQDGTKYYLTRGAGNTVTWDKDKDGHYISVQAYGPPRLTRIEQRTGDSINIADDGIFHYAAGPNGSTTTNLTRSVLFDRDEAGRITALWDPNSLSNNPSSTYPSIRYVYNRDTGNLIQVQRLTDRAAGTYLTTKYHYDHPKFPHYITSIEDPRGVSAARNEYDDLGRLTAVIDADGNRTEFQHNTDGKVEIVVDRLHHTNSYAYDLRGNVVAQTNALGGVTLSAYDDKNNKTNEVVFLNGQPYSTNRFVYDADGLLLSSTDPLGHTHTFVYNPFGQVTNTIDARGASSTNYYDSVTGDLLRTSDALGNTTTNTYGNGHLLSSRDPVGGSTANCYDSCGNLTGTALYDASGTLILSTNSSTFDDSGNLITSTIWRHVNGQWTGATTTNIYDAQNRLVQAINPDGGTNTIAYNEIGKQSQTIGPLGRVTTFDYDTQGRLWRTTYPDLSTETSVYDPAGNRTNSTDRAGRSTTYVYDALNRLTQTVFPDNTTNRTTYDDVGRVRFSVDARGTTNAFGYDVAGRRVAVTNALGTSVQTVSRYGYDDNCNQTTFTDALNHSTTNVFDLLNRCVEVDYPGATKTFTGYDAAGRRVAETNQENIVTRFVYDDAERLVAVTNAAGTAQRMITLYQYDEAGNETAQIDALNRTTSFDYDSMGRRIKRTLPGLQAETIGYDLVGNLILATNFNDVVITNQYDCLNRLTNRSSINGYQVAFAYDANGNRTNMTDPSGVSSYTYDNRSRLTVKLMPQGTLRYAYDLNGNVTNIWSDTPNGVNLRYGFDSLNRLTNVLAGGAGAASYGFDSVGNLQWVRFANNVTNLYQYDTLSRLTNAVWWANAAKVASFYYQLGQTGNRTNLIEYLNGTQRTTSWRYDALYRLTNETISALGSLGYCYDGVGNRTNRSSTVSQLPTATSAHTANDWLTNAAYDANGNTLWETNATAQGPYSYDVENRLTNFNNTVFLGYNGDGVRVRKTIGSTTTYYLVDDRNPSGYSQVLEEWTASGGATNLSRVYALGLSLISQRQPGASTNYFITDGHGSTRLLMDSSGAVVNAFAFDAYGTLIASNTAAQTVYLYCGEQFDPDLGSYYLRARYYSAQTGRFWTMDTHEGQQEDPLSLHKYLYCHDNAVNGIDPTGYMGDFSDLLISMKTMGYMVANIGIRATPALTRVTVIIFEAVTGETVAIGGGAAITGYAALSRVEGGMGAWTRVLTEAKGVLFGPYGYLKQVLKGSGNQAAHLNQAGAFTTVSKKILACVNLGGNALVRGTEHNGFHVVMERFWSQFREGGARAFEKVSNGEYLQALRQALSSVKDAATEAQRFTQKEIDALVEFAEKEQRGWGYHDGPGGLRPEVPASMNLK